MTNSELVQNVAHVDEPDRAQGYADVFSQVAADRRPIILRRDGHDLAAVVPLAYLEEMQDLTARQEAERLSRELDWQRLTAKSSPPQARFDQDEPKPF